ncbi:Carotenoid oxygenase [Corchorus olitorius]|uniref:Carotenoid oxygenase n=1 Tax=Corchorus olitorius TaxID=93759 RepID=A0A1R3I368_9ROSI|nr:Carotenoid oxygenase [Corchorus olitorius]
MILVRIYCNNIPVSHIPTKLKKLARPIISSNNSTPSFQTKPKTKIITNKTTNYSLPLSACSSFFSTLASIPHVLYNILDPPLHPWLDPTHVYAGNLAPVDEMEPTDCPVIEGKLPVSLKGVYIRNGPNPQLRVIHRALLLFDGDGMLHSLRFSDGHTTYCCRHVKTYKYLLEREADFPVVPNVFSGFFGFGDILRFLMATRRIVTGHFNLMNGFGVANTGLAFFANKLFALCESDLPYAIDLTQISDIETLGRWEFEKKLMSNMTAHPKVDLDTKETFAFSWSLTFPHLTFFRFNENGVKQKQVAISSIKQPCFIHDFAITKRFAIFHETQLVYSIGKVMTGRGTLVDYEQNKIPRIGIIPKYAMNDSEMKWFQVPRFNTIHIINAWENGDDEIVFVASNIVSVDNIFKRVLEEVPKMSGVVKIDLETGQEVAKRFYGPNCFGGEPLFVRRDGESNNSDEDDGYVMTYVHDEKANESKFIIMDAKSSELEIVAVIEVPRRVPYGFHGLFVSN